MEYVSEASKHQLEIETCSESKRTSKVCAHRPRHRSVPRFIHWYLLLRVEDDADVVVIRKPYRKLALQVHPDAEIAFELLLKVYKCLSDPAKRSAFDVEKRKNACPEYLNLPLCRPSREEKVVEPKHQSEGQ